MKTIWSSSVSDEKVLTEYPRPQFVRDSYLNLNGYWEYAITNSDEHPERFDGRILVPFSPEAPLSGVNRMLKPDEYLWYRREVRLPQGFLRDVTKLHFGAVDQEAAVFINGLQVTHHIGGYLPFTCDISDLLKKDVESFLLEVCVRDLTDDSPRSRGKQKTKRGGIWYTPQSGIWQTVWMESMPKLHIMSAAFTPCFDQSLVEVRIKTSQACAAQAFCDGRIFTFSSGSVLRIPLADFRSWSPEDPYLYDIRLQAGEDSVQSYFAMRHISVEQDEAGVPRLFLNHKPYFQTGVLDQGYWPDGLYTPPSDEAMVHDIGRMKQLGFNMLRKHIKIEPLRWYYHCDRLGMLVWQDMVSGGGSYHVNVISLPLITGRHRKDDAYSAFAREDTVGRREFQDEMLKTVSLLYNCPSIVTWVIFNEGWGQFDANRMTALVKELDGTRLIDQASGWHDQGGGDIRSLHVYFKPYRFVRDPNGRPVVLSEFGGYKLRLDGHVWGKKSFGYRSIRDEEELGFALQDLYIRQIIPAKEQGLCACVYTQLSDVEDELNGLLTYDRDVIKVDIDLMRELNEALRDKYEA